MQIASVEIEIQVTGQTQLSRLRVASRPSHRRIVNDSSQRR